jgi:hypothetical protein
MLASCFSASQAVCYLCDLTEKRYKTVVKGFKISAKTLITIVQWADFSR